MKVDELAESKYKSEEWWTNIRALRDNIIGELFNDPEDIKRGVVSEFKTDIPVETRIKLREQLIKVEEMIGKAIGEFKKDDKDSSLDKFLAAIFGSVDRSMKSLPAYPQREVVKAEIIQ